MSGLMSVRAERFNQALITYETLQKEMDLFSMRLEKASFIKNALNTGILKSTELSLANFQLSKLENDCGIALRLESNRDFQSQLKLRCEGVFSAIYDFIAKVFKWISDTLSSIFGGGSGGGGSNEKTAKDTIGRVEKKVEEAEKKKESTEEKETSKEDEEKITKEKEELKKKEKEAKDKEADEIHDRWVKELEEDKQKAELEANKPKQKLTLAEADKKFDVVIKGGYFFDYFMPASKGSYLEQLMDFRNNLRNIKEFTSDIKILVSNVEKGDEMREVFIKNFPKNSMPYRFDRSKFPATSGFELFGSMWKVTVMTMSTENHPSHLVEFDDVLIPMIDIVFEDKILKVSELCKIIEQVASHHSEIQKFSKEFETLSEEIEKKITSIWKTVSKEDENYSKIRKNVKYILNLLLGITEHLNMCSGIDYLFKTIDHNIEIIEA